MPLLQKSDHLPNRANTNNSHTLLLAKNTDADTGPRSEHAEPTGVGGGREGQEEQQSYEEENCCCRVRHCIG